VFATRCAVECCQPNMSSTSVVTQARLNPAGGVATRGHLVILKLNYSQTYSGGVEGDATCHVEHSRVGTYLEFKIHYLHSFLLAEGRTTYHSPLRSEFECTELYARPRDCVMYNGKSTLNSPAYDPLAPLRRHTKTYSKCEWSEGAVTRCPSLINRFSLTPTFPFPPLP